MNDIDRYLDQACRQVNGPDSLRAHLRKELKEHLEEAIDALVAEGMSPDDASAKAIEDLGDPEIIRDGMQSVYRPGVTSMFVELAVKWNDRRWHRLAQIVLATITILSIIFVGFVMLIFTPTLERVYNGLGINANLMRLAARVSNIAVDYWYLWLTAFAGAVGLFERKCRSDSKPRMRTSILLFVPGVCRLCTLCGFCDCNWLRGSERAPVINRFRRRTFTRAEL